MVYRRTPGAGTSARARAHPRTGQANTSAKRFLRAGWEVELAEKDRDFVRTGMPSARAVRVRVRANAPALRPGGHVVWMHTDRAIDTGLIWIDDLVRDVRPSPGWLRAGRSQELVLEGVDFLPDAAEVRPGEGLAAATVVRRDAASATVEAIVEDLGPEETSGGVAVLGVDLDGSGVFVAIVLPVLPAPPSVSPPAAMLARRRAVQSLSARLVGLDIASGVSARVAGDAAAGSELLVGVPSLTGGDTVVVEAAMSLGTLADDPPWIVFLAETGAAALRVHPDGPAAATLAPVGPPVTVGPDSAALGALPRDAGGLVALRAACADPDRVTTSLVARNGLDRLAVATAGSPLPHAVPAAEPDGGAGFVVVESEVPTTCELRYEPWLDYEPLRHDLESNDDPGDEESLPPLAPASARFTSVHLGRLDDGYDIDRYVVELPRGARIEAFAGQPDDFPGRTELALEVTGEYGEVLAADPWDQDSGGIAAVVVEAAGTWRIAVRAVAGSDGPYVLSVHEPVLLDEVDLWSGGPAFVELSAAPGTRLDGWRLAHRSGTGVVESEAPLAGLAGADGSFVVAATPFAGADAVWLELAAVSGAASIALVDGSGREVDAIGLSGGSGEGEAVEPPFPPEAPASLGRCLRVDTGDNAADFWRLGAPSPGAPNECRYRG